ncbi:MAG: HAD-IA family hydrolase, partial [Rhodospirillales bacterium]
EYFPVVIGGDSIEGVRKPDPRHLLAVIEGLGATPGQSVMVGDNENDVAAARAARVRVVVASFGYSRVPLKELDADMVFGHFDELHDLLGLP